MNNFTAYKHVNNGQLLIFVLFQPSFGFRTQIWPGLRGLWLSETSGQAMHSGSGLALAWPGLGHGFKSKRFRNFNWSTAQEMLRYNVPKKHKKQDVRVLFAC